MTIPRGSSCRSLSESTAASSMREFLVVAQRKLHHECAANTFAALNRDASTVLLHDLSRPRQAKTGSSTCLRSTSGTPEGLKHVCKVRIGNANAMIFDLAHRQFTFVDRPP